LPTKWALPDRQHRTGQLQWAISDAGAIAVGCGQLAFGFVGARASLSLGQRAIRLWRHRSEIRWRMMRKSIKGKSPRASLLVEIDHHHEPCVLKGPVSGARAQLRRPKKKKPGHVATWPGLPAGE